VGGVVGRGGGVSLGGVVWLSDWEWSGGEVDTRLRSDNVS
jgi:hypothetical protein